MLTVCSAQLPLGHLPNVHRTRLAPEASPCLRLPPQQSNLFGPLVLRPRVDLLQRLLPLPHRDINVASGSLPLAHTSWGLGSKRRE
jgi:hypothetical protein